MLYTLNLYSAYINDNSIKLGEKGKRKAVALIMNYEESEGGQQNGDNDEGIMCPWVQRSRVGLPSLHLSIFSCCFIYKVQGFQLYLAEGIGTRMSISPSQESVPQLLSFFPSSFLPSSLPSFLSFFFFWPHHAGS